jgi:outer membrane cobalamin receptor
MIKRLVLILFLVSIPLYSQTADSLINYEIKEIVVTASRNSKLLEKTPEVLHVISSKEIEQLNVSSTGEILEYLTGVSVETGTGSGFAKRSTVSLDGFPANYSLVMVDGIRLVTEHIHTGQNVDVIPPENIERIEVIKGASSAQYGSDAMGGIINIITKKTFSKTESTFSLSNGSYDTYNASLSVRSPLNENVSVSSFVNYEESAGVPILSPSHRIGNMGYTRLMTINNLSLKMNDLSSFTANLTYSQNSMQFRGDDVYSRMLLSSLGYKYSMRKNFIVNTRVNYSNWNAELSEEKNQVLIPEIYFNYIYENNLISAGVDFKHNKFTRTAVPEKNRSIFGIFLQDEIELDDFSFLAALRLDKVVNIPLVFTPKIVAMYQLSSELRIRGSFGRGFHAPSVQELYEEGYGHGGNAYRFGNPDLQPEYSLTTTLSLEYSPINTVDILLHGYYNSISDMITPIFDGVWVENPDSSIVINKWVRTNIHEAEIYGFESTFRYNLNDKVLFEGGYTYTHNRNVSTGGQLPYYPGESISAKLIFNYNLFSKFPGSCFISLRASKNRSAWNWKPVSNGESDNPDGLITNLDDYQLLNAGMQIMFYENLNIYMNIGNILGQNIQKLDDAFTEFLGETTTKVGISMNL